MTAGERAWVYVMTNAPRGVFYIGVTSDLERRVAEHKAGIGSQFVMRYKLFRLAWAEGFARIDGAIAAEKRIKRWRREWKIRMIEETNPGWRDLASLERPPAMLQFPDSPLRGLPG